MINEERKELAKRHITYVEECFDRDIDDSVSRTLQYPEISDLNIMYHNRITRASLPKTKLVEYDSVTAIIKEKELNPNDKIAVLNFASYTHPGGGYMNGSMAQEESLCANSDLYNVLKEFKDTWYAENSRDTNNCLYHSNILYSPDIIFTDNETDKSYRCDVITCAAPNKTAAMTQHGLSNEEVFIEMIRRICHIFYVANQQKVNTLILGAFGCGIFGNDPREVAAIFSLVADQVFPNCFKQIIYAVPKFHEKDYTMIKMSSMINRPVTLFTKDKENNRSVTLLEAKDILYSSTLYDGYTEILKGQTFKFINNYLNKHINFDKVE